MMKKKITGRLTSAVSAAALAVTAFGAMPAAPVRAAALTGQDAKGITSQMKVGWNLGNTLDCGGTGFASTAAPKKFAKAWGNPEPTEELFETVKQAGFNTVRIPTMSIWNGTKAHRCTSSMTAGWIMCMKWSITAMIVTCSSS